VEVTEIKAARCPSRAGRLPGKPRGYLKFQFGLHDPPMLMLEMIRCGPNTLSGGWNGAPVRRLMGADSAERTLRNVRRREKLEVR